jgi:hypothetical protein
MPFDRCTNAASVSACGREGCRKRLTPFSVRFLGGKQHISAMIVLCSAMLHGLTPRRQRRLETEFDVSRGTSRAIVRHWQNWWKRLPLSAFWRTVRGRLPATLDQRALPGSLLRVFKGNAGEQLTSLLGLLSPLTSKTAPNSQAI